jgi:hypothetical protein
MMERSYVVPGPFGLHLGQFVWCGVCVRLSAHMHRSVGCEAAPAEKDVRTVCSLVTGFLGFLSLRTWDRGRTPVFLTY